MTRVATFAQSQNLIEQVLRNQRNLNDAQVKVASGRRAQEFADLPRETGALLGAKSVAARTEGYLQGNREVAQRLDLYNAALGELAGIADGLREDVIKAVNLNSGVGFIDKLKNHFERAAALLNTRYQNSYIFAGSRTDTPPVNQSTAAGFLALGSAGAVFANNDRKTSVQVDETQTLEIGMVADDAASPLMSALYRILQFNAGTLPAGAGAFGPAGAFSDPLTANQRDFLVAEFGNLVAGVQGARAAEAQNGVRMQAIDQLMERQEGDLAFLKRFAAGIEDVDITEAVTRLKRDEIALEASLSVTARIGRLSLLDFI